MRQISRCIYTFGLLVSGACSCLAADALQIDAQPVFEGQTVMKGNYPITINLQNDGPSAFGKVHVYTDDGFSMDYPVELPNGSRKSLMSFPRVGWMELHCELVTDKGHTEIKVPVMNEQTNNAVLLISDNSGGLAFLKGKMERDQYGANRPTLRDLYCKPEKAPARPIGFEGISVVILGNGSERLSDATVQSLKDWSLKGGTLMFLGGASAPILSDARWATLLPGRDFKSTTATNTSQLSELAGADAPTSFAIVQPAGAKSQSMVMTKPNGVGKVVLLAFNPLEAPLSAWEGRKQALLKTIDIGDINRSEQFVTGNVISDAAVGMGAMTPTFLGSPGPGTPGRLQDDPFSTKLPPTSKILGILAGFFFVVVPLNFFVLKKLKRGELAWFTAPVTSLGFAGILFTSAQALYDAKLSTATSGILLLQENQPEAIFAGTTQMFFPRGGSYDFKLANVDSVGFSQENRYYYPGERQSQTVNFSPSDVGEIKMPNVATNNLAFRELQYSQRIPSENWVQLDVEPTEGDQVKVTIHNNSPYEITTPVVYVGSAAKPLEKPIAAGGVAETSLKIIHKADLDQIPQVDIRSIASRRGSVVLKGQMPEFRPGPQIGTEVGDRKNIQIVAFASETVRGAR